MSGSTGATDFTAPAAECDVVMKGGITSGVIYPGALVEIGNTYRIRGIGGASAGAIGAALGAAAEFGRESGGFKLLADLPAELGEGKLGKLFQPQRRTRQLLPLLLAITGGARPGPSRTGIRRVAGVLRTMITSFPLASLIGAAPGVALAVLGVLAQGWKGWLLFAAGIVLLLFSWAIAVLFRLYRKVTVQVPANLFGICRGLGPPPTVRASRTGCRSASTTSPDSPTRPAPCGLATCGRGPTRSVSPNQSTATSICAW